MDSLVLILVLAIGTAGAVVAAVAMLLVFAILFRIIVALTF
jgi:hypothetical protein